MPEQIMNSGRSYMAGVIQDPAGFVPLHSAAFGALGAPAVAVDGANPLPVRTVRVAASTPALSGTASASTVVGPFVPELGWPIWLSLSGTWSGTAQMLRSTDGGVTMLPLTLAGQPWATFTAAANEPIGEETSAAASYWLAITLSAGTIAYQVTQ